MNNNFILSMHIWPANWHTCTRYDVHITRWIIDGKLMDENWYKHTHIHTYMIHTHYTCMHTSYQRKNYSTKNEDEEVLSCSCVCVCALVYLNRTWMRAPIQCKCVLIIFCHRNKYQTNKAKQHITRRPISISTTTYNIRERIQSPTLNCAKTKRRRKNFSKTVVY